MARTRKSTSALNLYKYDVLIDDRGVRSDYFKISQFDGYFYGGRNAFLIAGGANLKLGSRILLEVLNKDGQPVYSAPIPQFIEGNSRLIQVEIYEDTPIGVGKIVILGCAETYTDGTPIPSEWKDKFNVRWSTDVIISPLVENKTPIRFSKVPSMAVTEKFYLEPSSSVFTQKIQVPLDIEFEPKYLNVYPNGYILKVVGPTTSSRFTSDYLDGVLSGSISVMYGSVTESAILELPLTKIYNKTLAETEGSLIYTNNKTLLLSGLLSSSTSEYSSTILPLGDVTLTGSLTIQYDKLESFDTVYDVSYAKIRLVDLSTISGEIHKIRVSYKPAAEPGEYILLGDIKTEVAELLAADSASKIVETGKFDTVKLDDYWYFATMSLQKNQIEPILPNYYNSSSLISSNLHISENDLLDAINATPQIVSGQYVNNVSYFIGNKKENSVVLFPRSEYTLAFNAIVNRFSGSTELTQSDYSLEVYLVSQEFSGSRILTADNRGQLLGVLTPNKNFLLQNFERVEFNFTPNIIQSGPYGIRFVFYGGSWSISDVSLKTAQEPFFSPDEVDVLLQNVNFRRKVLQFKAEYLDVNNNSIGISTLSTPLYFQGSEPTPFDSSSVASASYAETASYAPNAFPYTGSAVISGSLVVSGSITSILGGFTGSITTASYALTASYVAGGVSTDWNAITNKPSGLVSSSQQINTGSFSGSITTASYAASTDWANILNKPSGLVSSSQQINTGSFTGSFKGQFIGTSSWSTNAIAASYVDFFAIGNKPSLVSSSQQINTGSFSGSITSASYALSASYAPTILPAGTVSSSTQIDYNQIQNQPTTIATASYVEYTNVVNKPALVSSSNQIDVRNTIGIETLATTGSNTFTGIQTINNSTNSTLFNNGALVVVGGVGIGKDVNISGSLNVSGVLTVATMSTQYVTSSQLNVGTSKILLNDDDNVRFAGISIYDSGSTNATASIFWDSLNHKFIYQTEDIAGYTGGIIIAGPRNLGGLGDEQTLISGRVPVSTGGDHIDTSPASSSIRVDFSTLQTHIEAGLYVTGAISSSVGFNGSGVGITGIVSSSYSTTASYVEFTNVANKPSLVSSSQQINTGSFSGSITSASYAERAVYAINGFPYTGSAIISGALDITGSLTISGSGTLRNIGPAQFTGSLDTTGTVTITDNAIRMYGGGRDGVSTSADIRANPSSGNLVISAKAGAVFFNYDHGTGGVIFSDGNLQTVATIDRTGSAYFSGSVGVGTTMPQGRLHVVKEPLTYAHYNNQGAFLFEAAEAQMQIISDDSGNHASKFVLSTVSSSTVNKHWMMDHKGPGLGNRFDISYFTTSTSGNILAPSGVEKVTITTDGNVGIGTTTPYSILQLKSNSETTGLSFFTPGYDSTKEWGTRIWKNDIGGGIPLQLDTQFLGTWHSSSRFDHGQDINHPSLTTYSHTQLAVTAGNVGIGTTSPSYKLDINSGGIRIDGKSLITANGYFICGAQGFRWNSSDDAYNNVVMYDNGNMYVRGNVGIGTTNPSAPLHIVTGTTDSTGDIFQTTSYNGKSFFSISKLGFIRVRSADINGAAIHFIDNIGTNRAELSVSTDSKINWYSHALASSWMTFDNGNGRVGIGTISPDAKLHVQGNVSASSYTGSISADDVFGKILTQTSSSITAGQYIYDTGITVADLSSAYYSGTLYELMAQYNPNSGGSSAYKNIIHGNVYVNVGWNGSIVVVTAQYNELFKAIGSGSYDGSGANVNISFVSSTNATISSEATTVPYTSGSWQLRIRFSDNSTPPGSPDYRVVRLTRRL